MNIPALLSKSTISDLNCPDTVAVRVLLHSVSNTGSARIRCRNRQYIFERDYEAGCHILDIPMSVWMAGTNPGRYRPQGSVCDDFRELPGAAFTIHLIGTAPQHDAGALPDLRRLLSAIGAPEEVETAFNLATENPGQLAGYVDGIIETFQKDAPTEELERAREDDGTFKADDPATPEINEAFQEKSDTAEKSADPLGSPYTPEEAQDLENLHWKTFEKKYGMLKADFITSKETQDTELV